MNNLYKNINQMYNLRKRTNVNYKENKTYKSSRVSKANTCRILSECLGFVRYNQINNLIRLLKIYDDSNDVNLFIIILKETVDILKKDDIGSCRKQCLKENIVKRTIKLINTPKVYNNSYYFDILHMYLFKFGPEHLFRQQSYV